MAWQRSRVRVPLAPPGYRRRFRIGGCGRPDHTQRRLEARSARPPCPLGQPYSGSRRLGPLTICADVQVSMRCHGAHVPPNCAQCTTLLPSALLKPYSLLSHAAKASHVLRDCPAHVTYFTSRVLRRPRSRGPASPACIDFASLKSEDTCELSPPHVAWPRGPHSEINGHIASRTRSQMGPQPSRGCQKDPTVPVAGSRSTGPDSDFTATPGRAHWHHVCVQHVFGEL